jgi:Rieske Fe-S protein
METRLEQVEGLPASESAYEQIMNRRRLMIAGVRASATVAGVLVAGVGSRFVVGKSLEVIPGQWVNLGEVGALPVGEIQKVNYAAPQRDAWRRAEKKGVLYVLQDGADNYLVLDATCTHLGCTVRWDGEQEHFACPCHDAHFDQTGAVLSGPPPRGLRQLAVKVEEGVLWAEV